MAVMVKQGDEVEIPGPQGDDWDQPQPVSDLDLAFPARGMDLVPPLKSVPKDFPLKAEWTRFVEDWFHDGWPERGVYTRPEVDAEKAARHLAVVLGCYGFKHEHKIALVAWLASRWFAAPVEEEEGDGGTEQEGDPGPADGS